MLEHDIDPSLYHHAYEDKRPNIFFIDFTWTETRGHWHHGAVKGLSYVLVRRQAPYEDTGRGPKNLRPKNPASIIRMPTSAMASRLTARLWGTPPDHFHLRPLSHALPTPAYSYSI